MKTKRQEIIDILKLRSLSAKEISRNLGLSEKEVYAHLEHIRRSLRSEGLKLSVEPAVCLDCNYEFSKRDRLQPPGRCPRCKGTHIKDPEYFIK